MINDFRLWLTKRRTLSGEDARQLLHKVDRLLDDVKRKGEAFAPDQRNRLNRVEESLKPVRERLYKNGDAGVPKAWAEETEANRQRNGSDLESLRSTFFWNDRLGRLYEIAWWAEIGVLVGIVFYIAGGLSQGRFASEEIAEFWTEAAIAPIVVSVIFFLLALTGISGISSETSITILTGVAFILGFAIRRTLGLVDSIKKRILPEPKPGSETAA